MKPVLDVLAFYDFALIGSKNSLACAHLPFAIS